jgi:hypothetical protein
MSRHQSFHLSNHIRLMTKLTCFSFDSIICVAGGFDMGSVKDKEVFDKYEKLDKMNLQSALLTSHLATKYLGEQGLLVLTGAASVFAGPTNYAFAYGLTKSATHSLVLQMAEKTDIPRTSSVICILP